MNILIDIAHPAHVHLIKNTSGGCEEEYNYIAIDYTDKIFDCYNDIRQLNVIKEVVLCRCNSQISYQCSQLLYR